MATRTPLAFRIIAPVTQQYGPNGRAHWRKRARYVKEIREQAGWIAKAAGLTLTPPVRFRVTVGLLARQVAQPMDQLNLHGHYGIKAAIDGLADVLTGGEDAGWECIEIRTEPDPANLGYIEIELVEAA
jgi:hypothetical protein